MAGVYLGAIAPRSASHPADCGLTTFRLVGDREANGPSWARTRTNGAIAPEIGSGMLFVEVTA
jgi:hypothetical protein